MPSPKAEIEAATILMLSAQSAEKKDCRNCTERADGTRVMKRLSAFNPEMLPCLRSLWRGGCAAGICLLSIFFLPSSCESAQEDTTASMSLDFPDATEVSFEFSEETLAGESDPVAESLQQNEPGKPGLIESLDEPASQVLDSMPVEEAGGEDDPQLGSFDLAERGRQSTCRQDDQRYAVFDALFLQRNNATFNQPIVVNSSAPQTAVMQTHDLTSVVGTGTRLLYGNYGEGNVGWEVGYIGLYGMYGHSLQTSGGSSLQAAGNLGLDPLSPLQNASVAQAAYNSMLNSADINLVFHRFDGGYNRRSGNPWQRCQGYGGGHIDWLAGLRWAGLEDSAVLAMTASAPQPSTYTATTSSNLFAAQIGTRGRMAWERWAVEGWMKVGVAGTSVGQSQASFDALTSGTIRPAFSAHTAGMGLIADMNASMIYRLNETWGLRVGYNLFWLTGVALAPDQWDFSAVDAAGAGTRLNNNGSLFLSGAQLGLEAHW